MSLTQFIKYCENSIPSNIHEPWKLLNHGVDILQTELELNAYIASYGEMHYVKCRAALQNFPFKELTSFEIYDWGCGQGVATLTLIEMLRERNKLYGLKKITLIEPSTVAIKRASQFISQDCPNVPIQIINKPIPNNENDSRIEEIPNSRSVAIHLFSNILDVPTISLKWLANRIMGLGSSLYVICIGPTNRNSYRIVDFCNYFHPEKFFSSIDEKQYSTTSKTHHPFSCRTRCFFVPTTEVGIDKNNSEHPYSENDYKDDYSFDADLFRGTLEDDIIYTYNKIRHELDGNGYIFLRPFIGTDNPDIVVVRQNKGILILDVCSNSDKIEEECDRLIRYKENLINLHLREYKGRTLINKGYFSVIKTVLLLDNGCSINKEKYKYIIPIYKEDLHRTNNILPLIHIDDFNNFFIQSLYTDFIEILSDEWHPYKAGEQNFKLTNKQKELSKSEIAFKKIKGVAGCGKTQVLACRAVNAQVRTGGRVLILTFNITLRNYIKYRLKQVAADFSWSHFDITNYHQFFKSQANNLLLRPQLEDWNKKDYFENVKDKTIKYDAVFFDEAQDYKYEWFYTIQNYFLKEGGEFVVFGDGAQNIYKWNVENISEDGVNPIINGNGGITIINEEYNLPRVPKTTKWVEIKESDGKRRTMRINNPAIIKLAALFQKQFFNTDDVIDIQQTSISFDGNLKYWNIGNPDKLTIASNIRWIIEEHNLELSDTVILSQICTRMREIQDLIQYPHVVTTFETKEEYDTLYTKIRDDNAYDEKKFRRDIESLRRVKKVHFSTDNPYLKMSTIHSFKGWESKNVILIIEKDINSLDALFDDEIQSSQLTLMASSEPLIYTAITRAKESLFILNMDNEKYDSFFKNAIL